MLLKATESKHIILINFEKTSVVVHYPSFTPLCLIGTRVADELRTRTRVRERRGREKERERERAGDASSGSISSRAR